MTENERLSVAVVDDHDQLRGGICDVLQNLGFDIAFQASDGREALKYLAELKNLPDLCMMDVAMPVMDGYETTKAIRKKYPKLRVLAMSIDAAQDVAIGMIKAGACGFISKNVSPAKYRDAVIKVSHKGYYFDSECMAVIFSYIRR